MPNWKNYLENWSEREVGLLNTLEIPTVRDCVVVPLYRESLENIKRLENSLRIASPSSLILWIVNGKTSDTKEAHALNQAAAKYLGASPSRLTVRPETHSLIVNAYEGEHLFPEREGVGLARKLGADLALALHAAGKISSNYFFTTDADVAVPSNYFEVTHPKAAAVIWPFRHAIHECHGHALYDIWLRYYRLMLQTIHSPYAFFTIGSTLKIGFEPYALVRGFPKRNAGEDFYLLNKLRKVGKILEIVTTPIEIAARPSDRVPFGTGVGSAKALEYGENFALYDPQIFSYIGEWQRYGIDVALGNSPTPLSSITRRVLAETKEDLRLEKALQGRKNLSDRERAVTFSFDAFRTLKMVHVLQKLFPDLPWRDALVRSGFLKEEEKNLSAPQISQRLEAHCEKVIADEVLSQLPKDFSGPAPLDHMSESSAHNPA